MNHEQLIALLDHDDFHIRSTALQVIEKRQLFDFSTTKKIIKTINQHGFLEGYLHCHLCKKSPLDLGDAQWLLEYLNGNKASDYTFLQAPHLALWLQKRAPHSFIVNHFDACAATIARCKGKSESSVKINMRRRLANSKLSALELYQLIKDHLAQLKTQAEIADINAPYIEELIELMPDDISELEQEVMRVLPELPNLESSSATVFLKYACAYIAGKLGLDEAVPHLLAYMKLGWDFYNDNIPNIIARIGSDDAIQQAYDLYVEYREVTDCWIPNFITHVFEISNNPLASQKALHLLPAEHDEYNEFRIDNIVGALCYSMNDAHIQVAIEKWRELDDRPELDSFTNFFYTHARLTDQNYPEFAEWEKELNENKVRTLNLAQGIYPEDSMMHRIIGHQQKIEAQRPKKIGNVISVAGVPYSPKETMPERNAPCPCGSGKKYKKCCI